ncbi:4Fe-4S binding protein [Paraconexibacter antarcticus]|uniref:ferredoxin--NADP(+) reductase n=1 Tax=Paraconexibacter antarcticus TaxID=2949664 RepID=A0ABY5DQP8_9ACTN|nr:4Fe-4S binding protein [Paraconexibacter antarcticus]UTI63239.1 4Fe-4S binding protein [Paraconexibacter antarcticus]
MPHVVTQSCVGDGSCVFACPVNCIQPTPDDPMFELAEMLHIDPTTCVDCGACVSACPVDAIKPHTLLTPGEEAFTLINAEYHRHDGRQRAPLAPVRPRLHVRDRAEPLRVAIVGSGPAAMYAAEEILTIPDARVSVYERLPVPYGLVRSGVAPDHRRTRRVSRQFDHIRRHTGLTMHLGVEVGRDTTHEQLLTAHHAVIYAVGAATDRPLQIPGADLPGAISATQLVAWYNGHPAHAGRTIDLSHRRAVIIGNGNVALDIARILTLDPEALADTEIAPAALAALRTSRVEEIVIAARRGPEHSAFTLPELVGLAATAGVTLSVRPEDLAAAPAGDKKLELLRGLPPTAGTGRQIQLRYRLAPRRVLGSDAVEAIELERTDGTLTGTGLTETIDAGLLVTSIGYRGAPLSALPFDATTGTIPNDGGRVVDPSTGRDVPGTYVVGWIKRGPTGFIGTNKICSQNTVAALVNDYNADRLPNPIAAPTAVDTRPATWRARAPRMFTRAR